MYKIEKLDKNGAWAHHGWGELHSDAVQESESLNFRGYQTRVIYNGKIVHIGLREK